MDALYSGCRQLEAESAAQTQVRSCMHWTDDWWVLKPYIDGLPMTYTLSWCLCGGYKAGTPKGLCNLYR